MADYFAHRFPAGSLLNLESRLCCSNSLIAFDGLKLTLDSEALSAIGDWYPWLLYVLSWDSFLFVLEFFIYFTQEMMVGSLFFLLGTHPSISFHLVYFILVGNFLVKQHNMLLLYACINLCMENDPCPAWMTTKCENLSSKISIWLCIPIPFTSEPVA